MTSVILTSDGTMWGEKVKCNICGHVGASGRLHVCSPKSWKQMEFNFARPIARPKCAHCKGSGLIRVWSMGHIGKALCHRCHGTGNYWGNE